MNVNPGHGLSGTCLRGFLVAVCLLLSAGCGSSGPELVEIKGRVTYGGESWPTKGMLFFTPLAEGYESLCRPASAKFDTDGHFRVSSYRANDGLAPGRYLVAATCWKSTPVMGQPPPPSYVPKKYQAPQSSDLEVVIPDDEPVVELNLDIPKR